LLALGLGFELGQQLVGAVLGVEEVGAESAAHAVNIDTPHAAYGFELDKGLIGHGNTLLISGLFSASRC
jgi:hypothetical protein